MESTGNFLTFVLFFKGRIMNLQEIAGSTEITFETALLRLLVSFVAGMLIGVEREAHSQPAGMRTHILISLGSTLAMLLSIYIPQTFTEFQNGDPGRIAAQVVTGIGFLGAGAILRFGVNVKGLTTAASIWAMAILGMAIGAGLFGISAVVTAIILVTLTIMDVFEKYFFQDRVLKTDRNCDQKKERRSKRFAQNNQRIEDQDPRGGYQTKYRGNHRKSDLLRLHPH